jgi:hypothetical protein
MAQSRYFPPGSLVPDWYSKNLRALHEPSLWFVSKAQVAQSYRFLWLRTFHHPIAIRIEFNPDGTSRLSVKMTSGEAGYDPGHLTRDDTSALTKQQTDWFLGKIEENGFWRLPSGDNRIGNDGAQWIIEGVRSRNYHMVDRWSPTDGPVRAIALLMLNDLARVKISAREMY